MLVCHPTFKVSVSRQFVHLVSSRDSGIALLLVMVLQSFSTISLLEGTMDHQLPSQRWIFLECIWLWKIVCLIHIWIYFGGRFRVQIVRSIFHHPSIIGIQELGICFFSVSLRSKIGGLVHFGFHIVFRYPDIQSICWDISSQIPTGGRPWCCFLLLFS
jgi:hypothetical protein